MITDSVKKVIIIIIIIIIIIATIDFSSIGNNMMSIINNKGFVGRVIVKNSAVLISY
jgi:hypothetical protein